MHFKVISLDRTPQRFAQFLLSNPNLSVERFSAYEGTHLSAHRCIQESLITEKNRYSPGALGTALSHTTLWRQCALGGEPFHIAEDDVVLRADFWHKSIKHMQSVVDWDIILWTCNFDWPIKITPASQIASAVMKFQWLDTDFTAEKFRDSVGPTALVPLISAAGICCYSISPNGAQKMLSACLPIGHVPALYVENIGTGWDNNGIDVEMSRHYERFRSFIAISPLAIARNDHSQSTIRGGLKARTEV